MSGLFLLALLRASLCLVIFMWIYLKSERSVQLFTIFLLVRPRLIALGGILRGGSLKLVELLHLKNCHGILGALIDHFVAATRVTLRGYWAVQYSRWF